jgi:hypothetical protein
MLLQKIHNQLVYTALLSVGSQHLLRPCVQTSHGKKVVLYTHVT